MNQNFMKTIFFKISVDILMNIIFLLKLGRSFRSTADSMEPVALSLLMTGLKRRERERERKSEWERERKTGNGFIFKNLYVCFTYPSAWAEWFDLVWFYGISTTVGYLMPNPLRDSYLPAKMQLVYFTTPPPLLT